MKLFLDSAILKDIRDAMSWGIVDGVTTNPSLIKKAAADLAASADGEELNMESYIKQVLAAAGRMCPVSLEVAGRSADEMIEQGKILYERFDPVASNVVIKVPVSTVNSDGDGDPFDGIVAIEELSDEKIPVNATLVFTPEQALLAAKAGAEYVSPFVGRVDDRIRKTAGMDFEKSDYFPASGIVQDESHEMITDNGLISGIELVARTVDIFHQYELECEVIAASVRNSRQIRELASVGSDIATVPFSVLRDMINHPGTRSGVDAFSSDLVDDYLALFNVEESGE